MELRQSNKNNVLLATVDIPDNRKLGATVKQSRRLLNRHINDFFGNSDNHPMDLDATRFHYSAKHENKKQNMELR